MKIRRTTGFIFMSLFTAFFLAACGGGGDSGSPAPAPVPVPVVTTSGASSINVDNAVLNGTVNPNGLATSAWFEWGTSPTLATWDNTLPLISVGAGTADSAVNKAITGLSTGTTYYFRVAASNSAGTTKGLIVSLTTASPLDPPIVQTFAADNLSVSGATLHASVIPNGLPTTAFFQYGTDNTFAVPFVTSTQAVGSDNTSHQIAANLTGLTTGTKYYYRVVASNTRGTSNGATANFTTNTLAPTVSTVSASPVGTDNALLRGTVNPNGLATNYHFEWGTSSTLATFDNTSTLSAGSGTGDVAVSALRSGLLEATTYYFRVVATNATGTSQGAILPFTTLQNPPPTAIGHYNETVLIADSSGPKGFLGSTVATLDGSESNDPYGTITSYEWTQIGGANTVTISNPTSATTTFTAPEVAYGTSDNLVFQLKVTDNRGLSGTDNIWKNVTWGFLDDFITNSTGTYNLFQTLGASATFTYDNGAKRARVQTGNNEGIIFTKEFKILPADIKLHTGTGVFSLDFNPVAQFGSGGNISIRLLDAPDTYYELSTNPALVKKVRAGVTVDSAPFPFPYSQGSTYPIKITFSPVITTFEAFGGSVSLTGNSSTNTVVYFEVETNQQDAYFDNIKLEAAP